MKRIRPPKGVTNPHIRLRKKAGLTQQALADACYVTRLFVIRAEQAVYAHLSVGLLDFLGDELDIELDMPELYTEYARYQTAIREQSYGRLNTRNFRFYSPDFPYEYHPFLTWRLDSGLSRMRISTLYCVHPAVIFKFEKQPHLMQEVPESLLVALKESGYDERCLTNLCLAYGNYKETLKKMVHSVP